MSAQAPTSRVLFIGIVQDGKVVQERALPAGTSVTVGTDGNVSTILDTLEFDLVEATDIEILPIEGLEDESWR